VLKPLEFEAKYEELEPEPDARPKRKAKEAVESREG
jgi:hypothetical protein